MAENEVFQNLDKEKLKRMLDIKKAYADKVLTLEQARKRMHDEVGRISPHEFAAAEQLLKEEDPDECMNEDMKNIFVLFEGLLERPDSSLPFGHPVDAYRRENVAALRITDKADAMLEGEFNPDEWERLMEELWGYKIHYVRKQNQLYSALERKGFDRPSTTMWVYDDHVRDAIRHALTLAKERASKEQCIEAYRTAEEELKDLIEKEEIILFPTSLKLIPDEEFMAMEWGDREIGFFNIDMPEKPRGPKPSAQHAAAPKADAPQPSHDHPHAQPQMAVPQMTYGGLNQDGEVVFHVAEGMLTLRQINMLFRHMPVDFSYVDENDTVRFYSDTDHRIFPRSAGVIGREVRNCHPPKSVHLVNEIIEKFRSGEQSFIEFWINKPGAFIYICYTAIRDEHGGYHGILEMMQDCTHIRELEGSRTLLTWDNENSGQGTKPETCAAGQPEGDGASVLEGLDENSRLEPLIAKYPKLRQDLPKFNSKFRVMKTPLFKVMVKKATLGMMAENGQVPLADLITEIKRLAEGYDGGEK